MCDACEAAEGWSPVPVTGRRNAGCVPSGATWLYKLVLLIPALIKVRGLDKGTIEEGTVLWSEGN